MDQKEFRKLSPANRLAHLRGSRGERRLHVERDTVDETERTVRISLASEQPYERWWGIEVLSVESQSIRTGRLESGAPLLMNHDSADQVGIIESYEIAGKRLRVKARFSRSTRGEEILADVLDGIRVNASIGYVIHDVELAGVDEATGQEIFRVTDWEPLEGSLVAVPADATVGVGRAHQHSNAKGKHMERKDDDIPAAPPTGAEIKDRENARLTGLMELGKAFQEIQGRELAQEAIERGWSIDVFRGMLLERQRGRSRPLNFASDPAFGQHIAPDRPVAYGEGARHILGGQGKLQVFRGEGGERKAYAFGQFLRAQLPGQESAARWCRENGFMLKRDYVGSNDSTGGYLVPQELAGEIIKNMDTYGAFRKEAHMWPMGSDSLTVPTRASGVTATFVAADTETSASTPGVGSVNLLARELMAVTNISRATLDDSPISIGDFVAQEMSLAFATKEDNCGFSGDGTSTYGGMTGLKNALAAGSKLTAATNHDTAAEIDATDLANLVALLPQYAQPGAKWYMSMSMYGGILLRLLLAAGGNTVRTLEQGALSNPQFAGFPVVLTPALPTDLTADYTGLPMLFFGDLRRSAAFGDRQQISLLLDPYTLAGKAQIRIIGYERFHIINHGIGTASAAGPMVALVGQ